MAVKINKKNIQSQSLYNIYIFYIFKSNKVFLIYFLSIQLTQINNF